MISDYDERVAQRLEHGVVFIPQGEDFLFPPICVNCLKPATVNKSWGGTTSSSWTHDIRHTITLTTKAEITGIPYCDDCAQQAQKVQNWIQGINLVSVLGGVLLFVVLVYIGSTKKLDYLSCVAFILPWIIYLFLRLAIQVSFRIFSWKESSNGLIKIKIQLSGDKDNPISPHLKEEKLTGAYITFSNKDFAREFMKINKFTVHYA